MKATDLRLKVRSPRCGDTIEVELADGGWERVFINSYQRGGFGETWLRLQFDDGSETDINPDNIAWRWPAQ